MAKNETGIDITCMKQRLIKRQKRITTLLNTDNGLSDPVELDQTRQGRLSRMDALQMQAMAKETTRRHQVELQRIASALKRIEDDEYGYCVVTGEAIESARLEADPAVPTSLAAAKSSEK